MHIYLLWQIKLIKSSIILLQSKKKCLCCCVSAEWLNQSWIKVSSKIMGKGWPQGVKVGTLGRQNERNSRYFRLAHTSIFGLCFMSVCLMKSNCYSLIYSSLLLTLSILLNYIQYLNDSLTRYYSHTPILEMLSHLTTDNDFSYQIFS